MKKFVFILFGLGLAASFSLTGWQSETAPNQSGQPAGDLKITAEGAPVEVRLTGGGEYRYEYDKDKYTVSASANGSAFEIKVSEIASRIDLGEPDNVIIYIPDQSYAHITGVSEGSSLVLPAINADISVTSSASSVVISLPPDYNKTLNYTGSASSCSLSMGGMDDFAVSASSDASAVRVPEGWPAYDMLHSDYSYTRGSGAAKINIDVTGSAFIFN